jgi:hypothetical protein
MLMAAIFMTSQMASQWCSGMRSARVNISVKDHLTQPPAWAHFHGIIDKVLDALASLQGRVPWGYLWLWVNAHTPHTHAHTHTRTRACPECLQVTRGKAGRSPPTARRWGVAGQERPELHHAQFCGQRGIPLNYIQAYLPILRTSLFSCGLWTNRVQMPQNILEKHILKKSLGSSSPGDYHVAGAGCHTALPAPLVVASRLPSFLGATFPPA